MSKNYTEALIEEYERLHEDSVDIGSSVADSSVNHEVQEIDGVEYLPPEQLLAKAEEDNDITFDPSDTYDNLYTTNRGGFKETSNTFKPVSRIYRINCIAFNNFLDSHQNFKLTKPTKWAFKEFINCKIKNNSLKSSKQSKDKDGNEITTIVGNTGIKRTLVFTNASRTEKTVLDVLVREGFEVKQLDSNNIITRGSGVVFDATNNNVAAKDLKVKSPDSENWFKVEIKTYTSTANADIALSRSHDADIVLVYFIISKKWISFVKVAEAETDITKKLSKIPAAYAQASKVNTIVSNNSNIFKMAAKMELAVNADSASTTNLKLYGVVADTIVDINKADNSDTTN